MIHEKKLELIDKKKAKLTMKKKLIKWKNTRDNILLMDINIKLILGEYLPFKVCIKFMINKRCYLDIKVDNNTMVVIQSP